MSHYVAPYIIVPVAAQEIGFAVRFEVRSPLPALYPTILCLPSALPAPPTPVCLRSDVALVSVPSGKFVLFAGSYRAGWSGFRRAAENGKMGGWMDRWMDNRWMFGWMDAPMDG